MTESVKNILILIRSTNYIYIFITISLFSVQLKAQSNFNEEIYNTIHKATEYLDKNVSNNGGYVWYYLPDLSRRWGEMEAYSSMTWVQGFGTVGMGHAFLDIYKATGDEYYYKLAEKAAYSLIKGQLECGGWNYLIDFNGEESLKQWYNTIGKNGWRLEEFQHYYGNATFDDESTAGAADYLLRVYLIKMDPKIKSSLDKALNFILDSQYSIGAWPQRFPPKGEFSKNGHSDYTPYYTFNDNVNWTNLKFLITYYGVLRDEKLLDPILRGMNFFLISQQPNPQAGWALQYSLDLKPAGARTYEPKVLDPQYTARQILFLIKFYEITGDKKYLNVIEDALNWIESVKLESRDNNKIYIIPKMVEIGTNKPLFMHRKGSNVRFGRYYYDYNRENTIRHYASIRMINIQYIKDYYNKAKSEIFVKTNAELRILGNSSGSSLFERYEEINSYFTLDEEHLDNQEEVDDDRIEEIMRGLDNQGRWLVPHATISNPYIGEPAEGDSTTTEYSRTLVGDKYDTSPFRDMSDQKYISTEEYCQNIHILLSYLKESK